MPPLTNLTNAQAHQTVALILSARQLQRAMAAYESNGAGQKAKAARVRLVELQAEVDALLKLA